MLQIYNRYGNKIAYIYISHHQHWHTYIGIWYMYIVYVIINECQALQHRPNRKKRKEKMTVC